MYHITVPNTDLRSLEGGKEFLAARFDGWQANHSAPSVTLQRKLVINVVMLVILVIAVNTNIAMAMKENKYLFSL
jgi:hypothetical protein